MARTPHGSFDVRSRTVLLLVDVINHFNFPEASKLLRHALPAARRLAALKKRLHAKGIAAVYVNDNFGRWQSDFQRLVESCTGDEAAGSEVARLLIPAEHDYFVLKPKHSGFYSTSLEVVLHELHAERLIITGFAADICVLFTANDAYMRDYELIIPSDCIASETVAAKRHACAQMKRFLHADVRPSRSLRFRPGDQENGRSRRRMAIGRRILYWLEVEPKPISPFVMMFAVGPRSIGLGDAMESSTLHQHARYRKCCSPRHGRLKFADHGVRTCHGILGVARSEQPQKRG